MSAWIVYSKDGLTERCKLKKLSYDGSFMNERAVTSTFVSPFEIGFEIFDYIEYRGEQFEIESIPTVKKTSSFSYEYELRFVSHKYELERCEMRDIVPHDNGIVYPTPLSFSFMGNVKYLAERIQACLDDMYGDGVWSINVADGVTSDEHNITLSQQSCWNALALVNTIYKLNFYIKGRTVTIGGSQPVVDHAFQYGKGNGLYEIERTSNTDTAVVTKLRAYGSTRNLDYSYPKRPDWSDSILDTSFVLSPLRLMLPSFKKDGKTDYLMASDELVEQYGVREASIIYEDIYPSITGATHNGNAIDEIKSVEAVNDSSSTFVVHLHDLGFDLEEHLTNDTAQVSMKEGSLQGYTFNIQKIEKQDDGSNKLTLERITLSEGDTDNYNVPNSDWNMEAGDKFVLLNILMPQEYIRDAEERLETRAREYLAQYAKTNFGYNIGIHDKFLIENPSIYEGLIEGAKLRIYDEELGISEDVTIQSITIDENMEENILPQVKVTLNNEPSASTLDRIQGQINDLASGTSGSYNRQSEILNQYRRKLDRPYFDRLFVAVDKDGNEIPSNDLTTEVYYIRSKYHFATIGGVTTYVDDGFKDLPSIYAGIPIDNQTIYWEETTNEDGSTTRILKAKELEGSGSSDFSNITEQGNGNSYTSFIVSNDGKSLTFVKGEVFAKQGDFDALNARVVDFLEGSDTDTIINKWKELEAFLQGMSESDDLAKILETKWTKDDGKISNWDNAFSWGDHSQKGYALKTYVDENFVTTGTEQEVTGKKNFTTGGLFVNGNQIVYDADKGYWKLDGNLLVTGGVSTYVDDGSKDLPSIYDGLPLDNQTIYWEEVTDENGNTTKVLKAKGETEGGSSVALLGDLTNVGSWANASALEDRIMVQRKGSRNWEALSLSELKNEDRDNSNGMGYVVLKEDESAIGQFGSVNTIYEIRYDYNLNGGILNVPEGCVLKFEGGSLVGGTIVGNNTCIQADAVQIFSTNTTLEGNWDVLEGFPEWFGAKGDGVTDDAPYIQKCMDSFDVTRLHNKTYILDSIQDSDNKACLNLPAGKKFKGSLTKSTLTDDNGTLKVGTSVTPSVIVYIGSKCHISDMNIRGNSMSDSSIKQTGVKTFTGAYNSIFNVGVAGVYYGFDVCAFMSTIDGCTSAYNYIGFYVRGIISSSDSLLAENTSIFMKNCYAVDCYMQGYYLRGLIYSYIVSCGADGCGWQGYATPITSSRRVETYWIRECKGVSLVACGMEQATKAVKFSSCFDCSFRDSVFILKTTDLASGYNFNNTFVFSYCQNILLENLRIKHDGKTFSSSDKLFYFESGTTGLLYAKIVNIQNLYDGNLYDLISLAGMGTPRYDCVDVSEAHFRRKIGSTSLRPTLSSYEKGVTYYDEDLKKSLYWDGSTWRDNTSMDIIPEATNTYTLGTSEKQYKNMYAKEVTVDGLPISKYQDGVLYIDANLAVKGDVAAFAIGTQEIPTVMDGIKVDGTTISKENGYLEFIGSVEGGTVDDSEFPKLNGVLGSSADLNDATRAGYYKVGMCDNMPSDGMYQYGMLEVIEVYTAHSDSESRIAQVYYPHATGNGYTEAALAVRLRNSGTWTDWRIVPTSKGNIASATKATQDGSGNVITSTYLTKTNASSTYLTKTDASSTYLGKNAKAASATSADTATNLASAPSFSGTKAITITVGGKTSSSFTIPYATKAGSVDTADALTNTVSVWGQNFDGSYDISGDIDDVGNITPMSDDTYSLGSSSYTWASVWTSLVNLPATENAFSIPGIKFGSKGRIGVNSSGQVGIYGMGTSSGIYLRPKCTTSAVSTVGAVIDAAGNLSITGTLSQSSDERKKTILNHVELSLEEIANAPLVEHYYNCDDNKTTHVGSIAQYWAEMNDWFCKQDDEGYYTMEVPNCALASAISLARELVECKKEIANMKSEIEKLKGG